MIVFKKKWYCSERQRVSVVIDFLFGRSFSVTPEHVAMERTECCMRQFTHCECSNNVAEHENETARTSEREREEELRFICTNGQQAVSEHFFLFVFEFIVLNAGPWFTETCHIDRQRENVEAKRKSFLFFSILLHSFSSHKFHKNNLPSSPCARTQLLLHILPRGCHKAPCSTLLVRVFVLIF